MADQKKSSLINDLDQTWDDMDGDQSGESSTTTSGTGSGGGTAGQVEFKDFIGPGVGSSRDDVLPLDEKRRLIAVHKSNHEWKVKNQKQLLANRKAVKEGRMNLAEYREGRGYGKGMGGLTKTHPLSNTVQFGSGAIDSKINAVPNENTAETNNDHKQELIYQNRLENKLIQTYTHENRYTPKPSPFK